MNLAKTLKNFLGTFFSRRVKSGQKEVSSIIFPGRQGINNTDLVAMNLHTDEVKQVNTWPYSFTPSTVADVTN